MTKVNHTKSNLNMNSMLFSGHVVQGKNIVLHPFSLSVTPGQLLVVTGQNGSGKTTLLKAMGGFLSNRLSSHMIYHPTPESTNLFPWQIEWIPATHETPLYATIEDVLTWPKYGSAKSNSEIHPSMEELLNSFGMSKSIKTPLHNLSLGEQKRVYLAAMLGGSRNVWIMDEPTGPLDVSGATIAMSKICQELRRRRLIGIMATQDPILAARFADQWIILKNGEVVQNGDVSSIIQSDMFQSDSGIKLSINRQADSDLLQIEYRK